MKFESMRAWDEGLDLLKANREVVLAVAGVFFVLPALAVELLLPAPQIDEALPPRQQLELMMAAVRGNLPYFLLLTVIQQVGTLAMLGLFTDRSRPTVGQAIGQGLAGLPTSIASTLLLAIGMGIAGGLVLTIAAVSGSQAVVVAVMAMIGLFALWLSVRTSLASPVIAIERQRNPVTVLLRSWQRTSGNGARLTLFYALLIVGYFVILMLAAILADLAVNLIAGSKAGEVASGVVQAIIGGIAGAGFAAILAAIHRQLSGPSAASLTSTFD